MKHRFYVVAPLALALAGCQSANARGTHLGEIYLAKDDDRVLVCDRVTRTGSNIARCECKELEVLATERDDWKSLRGDLAILRSPHDGWADTTLARRAANQASDEVPHRYERCRHVALDSVRL